MKLEEKPWVLTCAEYIVDMNILACNKQSLGLVFFFFSAC